jgi:phenylpropionate dioxygenase-like ring-hydroxylating dioxygenase large terminal subunit
MLFFTLSDETASFNEYFPGLEDLLQRVDFIRLGLRRPLKYHSNNNWKATVDAYQECLHCAYAHPEFAQEFKPSVYKVTEYRNYSQHIADATSGGDTGLFLYLFPNCTLSLYAGGLTCWRTSPTEEPGKARMEFDYYHEHPEGSPVFEEWYRFTRNVALEDIELCEKSQANHNVGIYNSGFLNPEKENGVVCKSFSSAASNCMTDLKTDWVIHRLPQPCFRVMQRTVRDRDGQGNSSDCLVALVARVTIVGIIISQEPGS